MTPRDSRLTDIAPLTPHGRTVGTEKNPRKQNMLACTKMKPKPKPISSTEKRENIKLGNGARQRAAVACDTDDTPYFLYLRSPEVLLNVFVTEVAAVFDCFLLQALLLLTEHVHTQRVVIILLAAAAGAPSRCAPNAPSDTRTHTQSTQTMLAHDQ